MRRTPSNSTMQNHKTSRDKLPKIHKIGIEIIL